MKRHGSFDHKFLDFWVDLNFLLKSTTFDVFEDERVITYYYKNDRIKYYSTLTEDSGSSEYTKLERNVVYKHLIEKLNEILSMVVLATVVNTVTMVFLLMRALGILAKIPIPFIGLFVKFLHIASFVLCLSVLFVFLGIPNAKRQDCKRYSFQSECESRYMYKQIMGKEFRHFFSPSFGWVAVVFSTLLSLASILYSLNTRLKMPGFLKTGTTIVGVVYNGGVVLGADTRATEGPIVADKNCEKIHYISDRLYCCGAGTAADTQQTTQLISSKLKLHKLATGKEPRINTAVTMLKQMLFKYQGHVSAALILGGIDIHGPAIYSIHPHGSVDQLPFVTMGSGSLAAMAVLEAKYKTDLTRQEAIELVAEAIASGVFNDLGSGSNINLSVISNEGVEKFRNYQTPNERLFRAPPYIFPVGTTPSRTTDDEYTEYLYKILVVGDIGAGKTSIIKRFVHNIFSMHYKSTIGVDFALKVINWDPKTEVKLQLWDIAGQERFGSMTRVYYKEAIGAFIIFDVTRLSTFEAVAKWKADIDSKVTYGPDEKPIPVVLLANKCDLGKEGFVKTANEIDKYCKENGFIGWFETSAKDNMNIEKAARFLVEHILKNDIKRNQAIEGTVDPNKPAAPPANTSSPCCKI
eukprot:gene8600-10586_t